MSYGMNLPTSSTSSKLTTGGNFGANTTGVFKDKRPHGYQRGALQQYTPEQMQLFQQMFGQTSPDSYLSRLAGGDESLFEQMEAPALRQFSGLQGNLASRFSGMGMGGRHSSGFQNTINQAGADFASDLASRRQGLQRQAIMDLQGLSHSLLNERPYEQYLIPKKQNRTAEMVGKLGGAVPGLISSFMGGGSPGSALRGASSIFGNLGGGDASGFQNSNGNYFS